jgi:hypothetical protein
MIVEWNQDGHPDILMAYKGHRDFYILYGGSETAQSLLRLPMTEGHVESETYLQRKRPDRLEAGIQQAGDSRNCRVDSKK